MSGATRRWIVVFACLAAALAAQGSLAADSPQGKVKYVPAQTIINPDGAVVYQDFCAACHGVNARGNGPAARYLDQPVPDLTRIALRDGKFDRYHVSGHIRNVDTPKTNPMPCWSQVMQVDRGDRHATDIVFVNLTKYLERMQVTQ
jgi:mono/diheme cytochrome c family protein